MCEHYWSQPGVSEFGSSEREIHAPENEQPREHGPLTARATMRAGPPSTACDDSQAPGSTPSPLSEEPMDFGGIVGMTQVLPDTSAFAIFFS